MQLELHLMKEAMVPQIEVMAVQVVVLAAEDQEFAL
jgi:hypothetical protein